MIITCERCYEWAEQLPLGGSMHSVTYSPCIRLHCPILREHKASPESGATDEAALCPHMEEALAAAERGVKRRQAGIGDVPVRAALKQPSQTTLIDHSALSGWLPDQ